MKLDFLISQVKKEKKKKTYIMFEKKKTHTDAAVLISL